MTFGSFNDIAKLTPTTLALWAAVLRAVPGSRLRLQTAGLSYRSVRERLAAELQALGIDAGRVEFHGWESGGAHWLAYGEVDVALDTVTFNGGATTCEALWSGVPVVILAGDRPQARMGASILAAAACADWVAADAAAFVSIAARLAADPAACSARAPSCAPGCAQRRCSTGHATPASSRPHCVRCGKPGAAASPMTRNL